MWKPLLWYMSMYRNQCCKSPFLHCLADLYKAGKVRACGEKVLPRKVRQNFPSSFVLCHRTIMQIKEVLKKEAEYKENCDSSAYSRSSLGTI